MSELTELIADVKEQVLYLRELGGGSLAFDPAQLIGPKSRVQGQKSKELLEQPAPMVVTESAPRKAQQKESRLGSLPSLSKRSPVEHPPRVLDSTPTMPTPIQP